MENVIAHRFWICFGLSVVLIPVGWWMGSSSLVKEIAANTAEIEAANNGIPKGDRHPNKDWIGGLKKRVVTRQEYYEIHSRRLYTEQRKVMNWPASIAPAMFDKDPVTGKMIAKKFGEKGNNENARSTYRTVYYSETLNSLYKIVDPIGVDPLTKSWVGYDSETGKVTGKVLFNFASMPMVPPEIWNARAPEWSEMWDAQMDAWLVGVLLRSIKRTNDRKGTKTLYDASIKQIVHLMLRGGSRGGEESTGEGTGEGPENDTRKYMTPSSGEAAGGTGTDGADGMGGGGVGGGGGPLSIGFLDIDLGKEVPRETTGTGDEPAGSTADADGAAGGGYKPNYGTPAGNSNTSYRAMSPYVDNDPEMPFKTRGFVIQVLMKRKDLPLLIQELTDAEKSKFPIEILRIHEVDRDTDHKGLKVLSRYSGGAGVGGFPGATGESDAGPGTGSTPLFRGPGGSSGGHGGPGVGGSGGGIGGTPGIGGSPGIGGGGVGGHGGPAAGGIGNGIGRGPIAPGMRGPMGSGGAALQTNLPFMGALDNTGMGYVVIVGLMTIYQPPKSTEKKEQPSSDPAQPGTKQPTDRKSKKTTPTKTDGKTPAVPVKKTPDNKSTPGSKSNPKKNSPKKSTPVVKSKAKKSPPRGKKQPVGKKGPAARKSPKPTPKTPVPKPGVESKTKSPASKKTPTTKKS